LFFFFDAVGISLLAANNADLDHKSTDEYSPLHEAIIDGHYATATRYKKIIIITIIVLNNNE